MDPVPSDARSEVTLILQQVSVAAEAPAGGSLLPPADRTRLFELVYDELRRIAARLMGGFPNVRTLQPTALVHEAFLKLVDQTSLRWNDRAHFLGIAARAMRLILIDHARATAAAKRGGGLQRVTLAGEETGPGAVGAPDREFELLELDEALERLARLDERAARVAEMRLFAGMTVKESALVLGISPRSVDDDWATARAWLSREIRGQAPP